MKKSFISFSALAVVVAYGGYAYSQPGQGRGGQRGQMMGRMMSMLPIMVALDADKDGVISAAEIEQAPTALKTLDKDQSGALEAQELMPDMEAMRRGRGGQGFGGPGGGRGGNGRGGNGQSPRRPPVE